MIDGGYGSTDTSRDGGLRAREEWRSRRSEYVVPDHLRIPPDYDGHEKGGYITEAIVAGMEARILKGASLEAAKAGEFIPPKTWKRWRENASRGEEPYRTMMERLQFARKHYEGRKLGIVDAVSECDDPSVALRGAVKALEYANPEKYAPQTRNKTDVTVTMTAQINTQAIVALASLPAETVKLLAQALSARPLVEQTAPTPLLSAFEDEE